MLSAKKTIEEIVAADLKVCSYIVENAREQADAKWVVRRYGNVMFSVLVRCEPHVTAFLPRDGVAELTQRLRQSAPLRSRGSLTRRLPLHG